MRVCDGIKELQELYRACVISSFDFEEIRSFIIGDPNRSARGYRIESAIETIDRLVQNRDIDDAMGGMLKKAVYNGNKDPINSDNVYDYYDRPSAPTTSTPDEFDAPKVSKNSDENKSLKGTAVGVLLSLFIGLIGFILCLLLGDEKCKKASIYTFCACVAINIIIVIIFVVILVVNPNIIFPGGL